MAWYRAGTVTVANGSPTVTGAGTDFVANAQIGHAFLGPDGKVYEIAQVEAAGQITLTGTYLGASGAGQGYAIMPTSSFARDLALGAAQLLNTFAVVRDGVGAGLIPDGTVAVPAIRFAADQDTGLARLGTNIIGLIAGGIARLYADVLGAWVEGSLRVRDKLHLVRASGGLDLPVASYWNGTGSPLTGAKGDIVAIGNAGGDGLAFVNGDIERGRFDASGNLLLGTTAMTANGGRLTVKHTTDAQYTAAIFEGLSGSGTPQVIIFNGGPNANTWNTGGSVLFVTKNTNTGRSVNAAGTINASGADYAEYMTKAAGCGTIAKGDVCGVDSDGRLTKTWADAHSFVIKSTDPSYVGGDIWGQSVGLRPEGPGDEPAAPIAPPAEPASEDEVAVEAWRAIVAAYPVHLASYQSAHAAWTDAKAAYDIALPAWEAALETERQKVDRIAFSGQVPVNVTGDYAVGDYLIAAAAGAGIKAVAVPAADITFDQYRRRVGKVWAVRDGRAWVDVQHG